jgi:Putative adhesin
MTRKWMLLAAALLSAAATANAAEVNKQVPIGAQGGVKISNISGSVTITTWDRREVDVQGELDDDVDRVDVRQDQNMVDIRVVMKERPGRDRDDWGDSDAELQIRLPADVELEVSTVSAPISVAGVRGKMRLNSVSGDIQSDVPGTDVEARTVSGNVQLTGSSAKSRVRASSVSGDVDLVRIVGDVESRSTSGNVGIQMQGTDDVHAQTVSGDIEVRGALASEGDVELQSVSGRIKLAAKAPAGFRYDISTFSGDLSNCFGVKTDNEREWGGAHLSGTQGEGKASVRVKSHSGDVNICDK